MLTREQLAANAARTADYVRRRRVIGDHDRRRAVPRARYPELIESDYARRLVAILDDQRALLASLFEELPRLVANTAREDEDDASIVTIAGLRVAIEFRSGELRNGHMMFYDYGSLPGLVGADGEEVDVFIGPEPHPSEVYVVHQQRKDAWDEYDEDKTMLGFASADAAKQAYLAQYGDERFFGGMTVFPVEAFVAKLRARGYVSYPERDERTKTIAVGTLAFREDVGEGKRVHALLDRVREQGGSVARQAETAAAAIAARVSSHHAAELERQTTAGLGVAVPTVDAAIPPLVEAFVAENVTLVRSLATRHLDQLEALIVRAFANGTSWQTLAKQIELRFQIAERHARLIARDQISKLNAQVARARHQELGLHAFRWYAMQDPKTRPTHAAKHGKLWAYVAGLGIPVPAFFPGEEVCCRCGELPAFDAVLALLDPPPKKQALGVLGEVVKRALTS